MKIIKRKIHFSLSIILFAIFSLCIMATDAAAVPTAIEVATEDCNTSHQSDAFISLGEAILLANGDLARAALSDGEKVLVPTLVGGGYDTIEIHHRHDSDVLDVGCGLPEITANNLTIGGTSYPIRMDASDIGVGEVALEISGTFVELNNIELTGGGAGTGILATGAKFDLKSSLVSEFDIGVHLLGVASGNLGTEISSEGNEIVSNTVGALIEDSTDITLAHNEIGLRGGFLVQPNEYGLALIDVSDIFLYSNSIAGNTTTGLLASGVDGLQIFANHIGLNKNSSRPFGANITQPTGAHFAVLTQSLAGGLIPVPVSNSISDVSLGSNVAAYANVFCYNTANTNITGSNVNVTIGRNTYCRGSIPYHLREGANSSGGTIDLSIPTLTSGSVTHVSDTAYTVTVAGTAQAGTDVTIYMGQVDVDASSEQTTLAANDYLCETLTDIVGNFEATCEFTLVDGTDELDLQAQSCSEGCLVASEFSDTYTVTIVDDSSAGVGAGFSTADSGGGCSLSQNQLAPINKTMLLFSIILVALGFASLRKKVNQ